MLLSISNLSKTYNQTVKALDDVSIDIGPGMFGLLGPNGAGKSTLMRTVATLQAPDTGQIIFEGKDIFEDPLSLRRNLGYLPQEFGVYPKISAMRLLDYFATLKGISSAKERRKIVQYVLEITNLMDARRKNVSDYSGGMKQRFGIAQMLLNDPKLIIVDEPTAGLDPAERRRFLNVLREIGTDHIVLFSTHIVDDVRELCNDMAIMNHGRILLRDEPAKTTSALQGKIWSSTIMREQLENAQKENQFISSNYNPDNTLNIRVYSDTSPGKDFESAKPLLEDAYFVQINNSAG